MSTDTSKAAPVYLHLFHGRDRPDQDMDDWGDDGPFIGPLNYVHVTYMCDIKFAADHETMSKWFPEVARDAEQSAARNNRSPDDFPIDHNLSIRDDLIVYGGKYYGDWSVSTSPTG